MDDRVTKRMFFSKYCAIGRAFKRSNSFFGISFPLSQKGYTGFNFNPTWNNLIESHRKLHGAICSLSKEKFCVTNHIKTSNQHTLQMSADFTFKVFALKTPQGFGLFLEQDLASGFVFLQKMPSFGTINNFEYIDGVGCPPIPPSGSLQPMDILLEVNGQPIGGLPLATVQGILLAQPVMVAASLKWRRWSQFRPAVNPQQPPQIVFNNNNYAQPSHVIIPGQPTQGQQIRRTFAVRYGRYGFTRELNNDELRHLANRSLFPLIVLIPTVIIALILKIYFMLFTLVIIFPSFFNYVYYRNKADELDRLDRTSPLFTAPQAPPTQIVIAPAPLPPQQYGYPPQPPQYVQQPSYAQPQPYPAPPQQAYATPVQAYSGAPVQAQAYPVYNSGYDNSTSKSSM